MPRLPLPQAPGEGPSREAMEAGYLKLHARGKMVDTQSGAATALTSTSSKGASETERSSSCVSRMLSHSASLSSSEAFALCTSSHLASALLMPGGGNGDSGERLGESGGRSTERSAGKESTPASVGGCHSRDSHERGCHLTRESAAVSYRRAPNKSHWLSAPALCHPPHP